MESKNIHLCKIPLIIKIEPVMTRMQWRSLYDHALLTLLRILNFFITREEKSSSHDLIGEKVIFLRPMGRIWDYICASFRKIMSLRRRTRR